MEIIRRNSTLRFSSFRGRLAVYKSYHNTYDISDEIDLIYRLNQFLKDKDVIRMVKIYDFNQSELILEDLNQKPLRYLNSEDLRELHGLSACWIRFLIDLNHAEIRLDLDVSNIFLLRNPTEIVLIDPVCIDKNLRNFNFVVYYTSLYKVLIGKFWLALKISDYQSEILNLYIKQSQANKAEVLADFKAYITQVISWNRQSESRFYHILIRKYFYVGFWKLIIIHFKFKLNRSQ